MISQITRITDPSRMVSSSFSSVLRASTTRVAREKRAAPGNCGTSRNLTARVSLVRERQDRDNACCSFHAWDARCFRVRRRGLPLFFFREVAVVAVSDERFTLEWSDRTAVVAASGEIDITNAEGCRDALLSALNAGAAALVVDMTSTTFLDSSRVTALGRAARRATAADATLRLAVTAPPVL